jgi:hypothetical protein
VRDRCVTETGSAILVAAEMERSITPSASSHDNESKRVPRWRRTSTSVLTRSLCHVEIGLQMKEALRCLACECDDDISSQVLMEAVVDDVLVGPEGQQGRRWEIFR